MGSRLGPAIATTALCLVLAWFGAPRLVAAMLALPGDAAMASVRSGESVGDAGYERLLKGRTDALAWNDTAQTRIDLASAAMALMDNPNATRLSADDLLDYARAQVEAGLRRGPMDGYAWALLALAETYAGDPAKALTALRLSYRVEPAAPEMSALRATDAMLLWDHLADADQRDARRTFTEAADTQLDALAYQAVRQKKEDEVREALEDTPQIQVQFDVLVDQLRQTIEKTG